MGESFKNPTAREGGLTRSKEGNPSKRHVSYQVSVESVTKFIHYVKQGLVFRDVCHRFPGMYVADVTLPVDDVHKRHAPKSEEADLLAIFDCNEMFRIRQADKRDVLLFPILSKGSLGVWTNGKYFRPALLEFFILIPDARQRRAAIWSQEPTQEVQHDRLFSAIIRKSYKPSMKVFYLKVGGKLTRCEKVGCHRVKVVLKFSDQLSAPSHHPCIESYPSYVSQETSRNNPI